MAKMPWFKFWASDFLTDPDIDEIPLAAQALILRMWCVCHIRGSIPTDKVEIARLCRVRIEDVELYEPYYQRFFKLKNGSYISPRMEKERLKSELARLNVSQRYKQKTSTESPTEWFTDCSSKSPTQKLDVQNPDSRSKSKPLAPRDETPSVQTIFDLPLPGKQGEYGVPQDFYEECQEAYPGVSVMHELSRMRIWLLANPKRRKTESGMTRFINSWLAKKQNEESGGNTNGNRSHGKADRNLEVLAQSLAQGERQDAAHEAGVFQAGDNRRDDSGTLLLVSGK